MVTLLARCPCCDAVVVGVQHILQYCPALASYTDTSLAAKGCEYWLWLLKGEPDVTLLRAKVRVVGLTFSAVAYGVRQQLTRGAGGP